jgi:membrane complex biogenesis BtpA family protein
MPQGPLFDSTPAIAGMVHVPALPGTPRSSLSMSEIVAIATNEAGLYARHGLDAVIVENMHDVPYLNGGVGPEIVAAMSVVTAAVVAGFPGRVGVQVLAGADHAALAVALAAGAHFIRVENFAFAHVADEGLMPVAAAGPLLRYRRAIGAGHIRIAADIRKKHASHSITSDLSIKEVARAAHFFGANALIVTGERTGTPASVADVAAVRSAAQAPVWIGSGVTRENMGDYWSAADALLVGSYFKRDGLWENEVDERRVAGFMQKAAQLRRPSEHR